MGPPIYLTCIFIKEKMQVYIFIVKYFLLFFCLSVMIAAKSERSQEQKERIKVHEKSKSKKHDFLLSAKNLYLTYSNCELELDEIIILLKNKLSSYVVKEHLLVREYHASREPHVHVYLKLLKKTNIYSETFLDLKNSSGKIYHGNYQSARKPNQVIEYMLKNVSRKTDLNLLYSEGMSYLIGELGNFKDFYESLLDLAEEGRVEEAMNFLRQTNPELYLKQGKKLESRMIDVYKDKVLKKQRDYDIDNFYLSNSIYYKLVDYVKRRKKGENPVLAIVGKARHR